MAARDRWTVDPALDGDGWSGSAGAARQGFGSRVIERMIGQLKGKTHFDWRQRARLRNYLPV